MKTNRQEASAGSPVPAPIEVAILVLPETSASVVYGMYDLFQSAGRDWALVVDGVPGTPRVSARVLSAEDTELTVLNGVRIRPDARLRDSLTPDIVCIPEIGVSPHRPLEPGSFGAELDWLRGCYADGAVIATACSGALLLAEAGLLNGRDATTHWAFCDLFRTAYPQVRLLPQRALVITGDGGRLVMAGGGTSWLDLALYLIARSVGVEEAMHIARLNLIDWHDIGQQPFARLARTRQVDDALIARVQTWVADHYQDPAPVTAMVRLSGLAERSFKRRFQQATGMAPLEYVHTLRLEEAKQMLEATELPIEAIAQEVGYEDAGFFSRLFKRQVNLTPAQYRKRFGAMRRALSSAPGAVSAQPA